MTLRDVLDWLVSLYRSARADLGKVTTEPVLDWPLWIVIPLVVIVLVVLLSTFADIRRDEGPPQLNKPQGFWERLFDRTWIVLLIFLLFAGTAVSVFVGQSDQGQWLGYLATFNAVILGCALIVRFRNRR